MPTFIVEDGTGLTDATSYVSEAFSDAYLGSAWAADSASKQEALMAATEYSDVRWGAKLKGCPLLATQALEFPRQAVYDRYGVLAEDLPDKWLKAVCLYASYYVAGTLYPAPTAAATSTSQLKRKKTVVGPITTEVEYASESSKGAFLSFPLADKLASQYTYNAGGGAIRT